MANVIDIERIFKETWGYIGAPLPELIINRFNQNGDGANTLLNPQNHLAAMAREYDNIGAKKRKNVSDKGVLYYYYTRNGSLSFMPVWLQDAKGVKMLLENAVLSISSSKNIVSTALVNRDGEVNEEISISSWQIDVKGILVGYDGNYPEKKVQELKDAYMKRESLDIENVRTAICLSGNNAQDLKNTEKVIILDLEFPELRGFEDLQTYELQLKSNVEFSLYID